MCAGIAIAFVGRRMEREIGEGGVTILSPDGAFEDSMEALLASYSQ